MAIRVGSEYIAYRVRRFVFLTQLAWCGAVVFLTVLSLLELLLNRSGMYATLGFTASLFITMMVVMQRKIMRTELANLEDEIEAEIYYQRHRLGLL